MQDLLEKFRRLTHIFDPIYKPIDENSANSYYIPEIHEDYRGQLDSVLDLNDNAKLLVAGQPGCGKTTLLRDMARTLQKSGRVVVFVDLETCVAIGDLDPAEVYLATLVELLESKDAQTALPGSSLQQCLSFIAELQLSQKPPSDPTPIARILKRHLENLRDSPELRAALRSLIEKKNCTDPFEILDSLLQHLSNRRPVIILDGLDKIPPERAKQTFLGNRKKPMAETAGAAIVTIPISIVYEPTYNVLSDRYNNADSAVLPAVRLWQFDMEKRTRSRSPKGFEILKKIVAARVDPIDPAMILETTVERAVEASGGNIRVLARLIQSSAVKAYAHRRDSIEPEDVEAAIGDQREAFRRAYDPRFLPLLRRVHREYRLDDSTETAKDLLYGLWVMEYRNGDIWYSLPVPVEQLLQRLERSSS